MNQTMDDDMSTESAPAESGGWENAESTEFGGSDEPVAQAGEPLAEEDAAEASREYILDALRTVFDPEIPVNIYDLGLIYDVDPDAKGDVRINMTLTSPGCPVAGILPQQAANAVAAVEGVGEVVVYLVWDPPWDVDKMTEDAQLSLGMF